MSLTITPTDSHVANPHVDVLNLSASQEAMWLHGLGHPGAGMAMDDIQRASGYAVLGAKAPGYCPKRKVVVEDLWRQRSYRLSSLKWAVENVVNSESLIRDTYISQSTFGSFGRKAAGFKKVQSAWVDLDYYCPDIPADEWRQIKLEHIQAHLLRMGLPRPTLIVDSGKGAYVKWLFTREVNDLPAWNKLQDCLSSLFTDLSVDYGARDAARVLRCLQTTNSKNNAQVSVIAGSGQEHDFEVFFRQVADIFEREVQAGLMAVDRPRARRQSKAAEKLIQRVEKRAAMGDMAALDIYARLREPIMMSATGSERSLNWARFCDLRDLAMQRGGFAEGQRDKMLFWMTNSLAHAGVITPENWDDELALLLKAFPVGHDFDPVGEGSLSSLKERLVYECSFGYRKKNADQTPGAQKPPTATMPAAATPEALAEPAKVVVKASDPLAAGGQSWVQAAVKKLITPPAASGAIDPSQTTRRPVGRFNRDLGLYRPSNQFLISYLEITEQEQKGLRTLIGAHERDLREQLRYEQKHEGRLERRQEREAWKREIESMVGECIDCFCAAGGDLRLFPDAADLGLNVSEESRRLGLDRGNLSRFIKSVIGARVQERTAADPAQSTTSLARATQVPSAQSDEYVAAMDEVQAFLVLVESSKRELDELDKQLQEAIANRSPKAAELVRRRHEALLARHACFEAQQGKQRGRKMKDSIERIRRMADVQKQTRSELAQPTASPSSAPAPALSMPKHKAPAPAVPSKAMPSRVAPIQAGVAPVSSAPVLAMPAPPVGVEVNVPVDAAGAATPGTGQFSVPPRTRPARMPAPCTWIDPRSPLNTRMSREDWEFAREGQVVAIEVIGQRGDVNMLRFAHAEEAELGVEPIADERLWNLLRGLDGCTLIAKRASARCPEALEDRQCLFRGEKYWLSRPPGSYSEGSSQASQSSPYGGKSQKPAQGAQSSQRVGTGQAPQKSGAGANTQAPRAIAMPAPKAPVGGGDADAWPANEMQMEEEPDGLWSQDEPLPNSI